jgi:hypothetical protein
MAEPKQPEITISERLYGADFRELMPETCGSRRGGMSNLASYRSLDVLFCSRWSHPENSLKLIVKKVQCSPTGVEDCRPSNRRIIRAVRWLKSASPKAENDAYELLNNPATIPEN